MDATTIFQIVLGSLLALVAWTIKGMSSKIDKLLENDSNHRVVQAELKAGYAALDARLTKLENKE